MGLSKNLAEFVSAWNGKKFEWGYSDCNILALAWLDVLSGLGGCHFQLLAIGRYTTREEASEFAKKYPIPLDRLLHIGGANLVAGSAVEGDFLLSKRDYETWHRSHICLADNRVLTATPDLGVVRIPIEYIDQDYKIMRVQ